MKKRIIILKKLIQKQNLDALLISSVASITYFTGYSNFSKDEREAFLFITKKENYILTDLRYSQEVLEYIPNFTLLEISSQNSIKDHIAKIVKDTKIKKIGFEEQNITVSEFINLKKSIKPATLVPLKNTVPDLRIIKNQQEIEKIEKACIIGDKTFTYILTILKKGISEIEVANLCELFIKKNGGNISFPPIVAFGQNSSVPHHKPNNQRLKIKDQILIDFGVKIDNYCSDMTRTVFFGKATLEQKKIYQTVLTAQQKAIDYLYKVEPYRKVRPYRKVEPLGKDVDKVAREYIISQGYPTIPHSLGHGIGIEVHESPSLSPKSKDILKAGMVFSIEPGIYLPGFGGVRIEDLVVLEKSGPRFLTKSTTQLICL